MLIGYARVSTHEQNLQLQLDALEKAGCEKIITDKISGSKDKREGLEKLWEILREKDTLVIWRLDRLSRSLKHLLQIITDLKEKGIELKSLNESIDTNTPAGQLMLQVFGALNEFQRNIIVENTKAGLAAARARGKTGGAKFKLDEAQVKMITELYNGKNTPVKDICKLVGITKPTLYRYIKAS